jgi:MEMO1 family protein
LLVQWMNAMTHVAFPRQRPGATRQPHVLEPSVVTHSLANQSSQEGYMTSVREPAVAGLFYPLDPDELRGELARFLEVETVAGTDAPKALIVPHAGYAYSGLTAGAAYARLAPVADAIRRVVVVGPAHRVPVTGLALPAAEAFATPLGTLNLDTAAAAALQALPQVSVDGFAHAQEHSLEVQLPFAQQVLGDDFLLVPMVVGDTTPEEVAAVLDVVWGAAETLIIVSSDLSHYHDYDTARKLDADTSRAIQALAYEDLRADRACGCVAIQGLLLAARRRGLRVETVDLRNSGDTAGRRDQVVGYGAYVIL